MFRDHAKLTTPGVYVAMKGPLPEAQCPLSARGIWLLFGAMPRLRYHVSRFKLESALFQLPVPSALEFI